MNKLLQPDISPMSVGLDSRHSPAPRSIGQACTSDRLLPRSLLIIVLIALVGRLAILPWFNGIPPKTVDEVEFNKLAVSIVQRGEYAYTPGKSTSMRPPLYPTFVAGVYAVAGAENFQAVRLTQILLSLLTVVIVYRLAREMFDRTASVAAAATCAAYPSLWGHSYLLLTEVLFTFLLCSSLLFIVRFLRTRRLVEIAGAGLLLGLASLTRSAMFFFPPAMILLLLCNRQLSWGRRFAAAAVFVTAFSGAVGPWLVRNARLQGTPTLIDSSSGRILHWAWSVKRPDPPAQKHGQVEPPSTKTEGQMDSDAVYQSLGYATQRPDRVASHIVDNFLGFWSLDRELVAGATYGNFGNVPKGLLLPLACLVCGGYVLCLWTGILGFAIGPFKNRWAEMLLIFVIAHICVVHSVVFGHSRYHIGVMPLVALYSGRFFANPGAIFYRCNRGKLLVGSTMCLTLLALWVIQVLQDRKIGMIGKYWGN